MCSPADHHGLRSSSGFSLVEMIVAVMIFSIGILGMSTLMAVVATDETRATFRIETTEIVQNKLEEFYAIASAGTADTMQLSVGGSLTTPQTNHSDTAQSSAGRWFRRLWTVEAAPGGSRKVTVRGEPRDNPPLVIQPVDLTTNVLIN